MNRWHSFRAGLVSRVDWMVSQVENHEALAESAIRDLQRHAARAKVQLARVHADGRQLEARRDEAREAEGSWRERARKAAETDEARALECLRRAKRAGATASGLEERAEEQARIERQLGRDLARVEERLGELRIQRNRMRTRQSRAEALAAVGECESSGALDDVFDRWETRITEREFAAGCDDGGDRFEFVLEEEESEESLRDELALLRDESSGSR